MTVSMAQHRQVNQRKSSMIFLQYYILLTFYSEGLLNLSRPPAFLRSQVPIRHQHQHTSPSMLWMSLSANATGATAKKRTNTQKGDLRNASLSKSNSKQNGIPEDEIIALESYNFSTSPERAEMVAEAQALLEKARQLKAEALANEASLKQARSTLSSGRIRDTDDMIDRLFYDTGLIPFDNSSSLPALEEQTAERVRAERLSPEQVMAVLERLHQRQIQVQDSTPIMTPTQAAVTRPSMQIADTRNAVTANVTEWKALDGWIVLLINAASVIDAEVNEKLSNDISFENGEKTSPAASTNIRWTGRVATALKARRKELVRAEEEDLKRKIAFNVKAVVSANKKMAESARLPSGLDSVQEFTRQTLGVGVNAVGASNTSRNSNNRRENNMTSVMEKTEAAPRWVPSSLLPLLIESRATLRKEDVALIKDKVLIGSRFFCTSSDALPSVAVFRGNIRTPVGLVDTSVYGAAAKANSTAVVLAEIQQRLEAEGLNERVQLFMLEDQEWRPFDDERSSKPLPVILAFSKKVQPTEVIMERATNSLVAKTVSTALTFVATFVFSVSCYALNPTFFDSVINKQELSFVLACIPLCVGVISIQGFHEAAHYLAARRRNIKIGRPIPLPCPQLGTFGCITPVLSFPSDRKSLFDLALSGPMAGLAISLLMMFGGIQATIRASNVAISTFPMVPVGLFKCSLLTSTMLATLAPKLMMLPTAQPIPVHPLFLSGFAGLISSSLNLLPIFRLDGGRIVATLFGPRFTGVSSATTLLFMLSLSISGSSSLAFLWGLLIVFFQRKTEVPVRDDVTKVDNFRFGTWVGVATTALLALLPSPGGVFL